MKTFFAVAIAFALIAVAGAGMADTTSLSVTASVNGTCKFTGTSAISFVLDPSSSADGTAIGSVTYWCTKGASGTLAVEGGQHDSGGDRYMQSLSTPAEQIKYTLSPISDLYTGQGKNLPKTLTITGTVANIDYINAAALIDYSDYVTVTINP